MVCECLAIARWAECKAICRAGPFKNDGVYAASFAALCTASFLLSESASCRHWLRRTSCYDIELASADLLLPVVSHNLGLAFMPEDLAAQALSEKRIVSIPLTEEIPNRYICLVRDPSRPLGAAARCLIDMLLADRIG